MKILFISHRIPYPPNKGDKIRSYNILRYLSRHHEVYLSFLIDDPGDRGYVHDLSPLVQELFSDTIHPRLKKAASITAFSAGLPISVPYFHSAKLQNNMDRLLDRVKVDAVFCFSSPTAEYIFRSRHRHSLLNNSISIMDFIDMDSLKWRQYADNCQGVMRWIYRRESRCLEAYERKISRSFDHLLLVSESERTLFLNRIACGNLLAVPNGVDIDFFKPDYVSPLVKKGTALVFTGAMDYWPNIEGVIWFVRHVFPQIRKNRTDIAFYIVGSRPAPEVQALAQTEGVVVTGFVDDVRDYVAMADICVVPLRIARGIQNKVLEAMAMGKPVVTTPEGLEGIAAIPGKDILVAGDAAGFADQTSELLREPDRGAVLGQNARYCVESRYSWESNLSVLHTMLR